MTLITVFGVINNLEFGDRHVFSCEIALIDKELSFDHYGIARDFFCWLIEIARDYINIVDLLIDAVSEDLDFKQLFSSLFNLVVRSFEEHIIDGSCDEAKYDHENSENGYIFEDIDKRDQILEDEEWRCHCVE
jgi:hypothetical protein